MRTSVPKEFTIGESLAWTKSYFLYPATDWTLRYYFRGAGPGFDVDATADGAEHVLTVAADTTAGCEPGEYVYQAFASKGSERVVVDSGTIEALTSLLDLESTETLDNRSEVKKTLDAIDARIKGDVTKGVLEYTIGDRQLKRYSMKELAELRKTYAALYAQELQAAAAKKGGGLFKNHYVRFRRTR